MRMPCVPACGVRGGSHLEHMTRAFVGERPRDVIPRLRVHDERQRHRSSVKSHHTIAQRFNLSSD